MGSLCSHRTTNSGNWFSANKKQISRLLGIDPAILDSIL